jgi:hypothetical protein
LTSVPDKYIVGYVLRRYQMIKFTLFGFQLLVYQADPLYRPEHLQLWLFANKTVYITVIPVILVNVYFRLTKRNTLPNPQKP